MRLSEYQEKAFSTAVYQGKGEGNLEYVGLGLGGETGELQEILKRVVYRGEELDRPRLLGELGDVLWYISGTVTESGEFLSKVAGATTFSEFQEGVRKSWYSKQPIERLGLLLGSAAGKVQDAILQVTHPERPVDVHPDILLQLRICLQYLTAIGQYYNMTLTSVAQANLAKLSDRKVRGVLRGTGDMR